MNRKKILVIVGPNSNEVEDKPRNLKIGLIAMGLGLGTAVLGVDVSDKSSYGTVTVDAIKTGYLVHGQLENLSFLEVKDKLLPHNYAAVILIGTHDAEMQEFCRIFAREAPDGKILHLTGYEGATALLLDLPKGYRYTRQGPGGKGFPKTIQAIFGESSTQVAAASPTA